MIKQEVQPGYVIQALSRTHIKSDFLCGQEPLDQYLKHRASQEMKKNISVSYVLTQKGEQKVLGFFTLSSTSIMVGELPEAFSNKLPKYPLLPAILIGRLAVDQSENGKGLGSHLLMDALKRSLDISLQLGVTAVLVEAKDNAAKRFYEHFEFIAFEQRKHTLFLPMDTIKNLDL